MKEKPTPRAILELLGLPFAEKTNRLQMVCPFHPDWAGDGGSASFYLDTDRFYCYGCEVTANTVGFYAKYKEISRDEAAREIMAEFGEVPEEPEKHKDYSARLRAQMERSLQEFKGKLPRKDFALFGERLDKILWYFEKGVLKPDQIEPAVLRWYKELGATNAPKLKPVGAATDSLHDRLKEGLRDISRHRRQGGGESLEGQQFGVAHGAPTEDAKGERDSLLGGTGSARLGGDDGSTVRDEPGVRQELD